MKVQNLQKYLQARSYPGRGIVLGLSEDETKALMAYFIMGRSENSRNRVFTEKDGGIITQAADPAKMEDPSLIIYAPVREHGTVTIVTNGDQTDTVYDFLEQGKTFVDALRTREFEPDYPNLTPRISAELALCMDGFEYDMAILKSAMGNGASTQRFFYEYSPLLPGVGHILHTYEEGESENGGLLSFEGEPVPVRISGSLDAFGEEIWNALDEENKVSLFVRSISISGDAETRIYNKYSKV